MLRAAFPNLPETPTSTRSKSSHEIAEMVQSEVDSAVERHLREHFEGTVRLDGDMGTEHIQGPSTIEADEALRTKIHEEVRRMTAKPDRSLMV